MDSILQTEFWAKFKSQFGWRTLPVLKYFGLERELFLGRSMLYFPELPNLLAARGILKALPVNKKRIFTRFEINQPYSEADLQQLSEMGLIKSFEEVQPEHRQVISLQPPEQEILNQIKPKGRYNINVAKRSHLTLKKGGQELLNDFVHLYEQTANRAGFSGRSLSYFQQLVSVLEEQQAGEVIVVYSGRQPLAAAIICYYGGVASYLYGGSANVKRELMAPYLLHFEAMRCAKERGCHSYDLLAVSPPDLPNHKYAGITHFKTQFGGTRVDLVGSYDLVHRQGWYTLYKFAQKLRRKI